MSSKVRFGIIGVGNMGSGHVNWLLNGKVKRSEVTAICDHDQSKMDQWPEAEKKLKHFTDSKALIRSGLVDVVLIATPHFDHTTIGIDALGQGLHVLVEKPLSVHKADCEKLIEAYKKRPKKTQLFGAMFNQRTDPKYIKLRNLIQSGELGEIRRVNWIITDWYRTQAYYTSGGWRATYKGEGGGVLSNQCPHNLDLMQWLFGMPVKVRGHIGIGKWHDIEVEDAVTAYLEYGNGATGVFITTTGEFPGTNRLEVTGDRGKVIAEHGKLTFVRTTQSVREHCSTTKVVWSSPETWNIEIPVKDSGDQHVGILNNFADAVLDGTPLIAQAVDGIHSVELGNAMVLSSVLDKTLSLPLDTKLVEREYKKLIASSKYEQKAAKVAKAPKTKGGDFSSSFAK
jgi:predicted dehydrogenase